MSNGVLALVVLVALAVGWGVSVFNRLVRGRTRMNNAFAQIDKQLKHRHDLVPNLVNTARGYLQHERQTLQGVTLARQRAVEARHALAGSFGSPASRGSSDSASRSAPGEASSGARGTASAGSLAGDSAGGSGVASDGARDGVAEGAAGSRAGTLALLEVLDRAESGLNTALGKFAMVVETFPELKADPTLMQVNVELGATEKRISLSRQVFNDAVTSHNDELARFPASLIANACGFTAAGQLRSTIKKTGERPPAMLHLP